MAIQTIRPFPSLVVRGLPANPWEKAKLIWDRLGFMASRRLASDAPQHFRYLDPDYKFQPMERAMIDSYRWGIPIV